MDFFASDKVLELTWKLFPAPVPIPVFPTAGSANQPISFEAMIVIKPHDQIISEAASAIRETLAPLVDEFWKSYQLLCMKECDGIPSDPDHLHTEACLRRRELLSGWKPMAFKPSTDTPLAGERHDDVPCNPGADSE